MNDHDFLPLNCLSRIETPLSTMMNDARRVTYRPQAGWHDRSTLLSRAARNESKRGAAVQDFEEKPSVGVVTSNQELEDGRNRLFAFFQRPQLSATGSQTCLWSLSLYHIINAL